MNHQEQSQCKFFRKILTIKFMKCTTTWRRKAQPPRSPIKNSSPPHPNEEVAGLQLVKGVSGRKKEGGGREANE